MKHKVGSLITYCILGLAAPIIFLVVRNNFQVKSSSDIIKKYTTGKQDIVLTVGTLKNGQSDYTVYGYNGEILPEAEHQYEIGSVSKTFTTSLLSKDLSEGNIKLEDSISEYLPLDTLSYYPTIERLATHTSGYGDYPFDDSTMSREELNKVVSDFSEKRINIYNGLNIDFILAKIEAKPLEDKAYDWEYSNFGISTIAAVLSEKHDSDYRTLMNSFIKDDLGLQSTFVGNGTGDLNDYWNWNDDDCYIGAGGIVSTVTDMLKYCDMNMKNEPEYLSLSHNIHAKMNEDYDMGLAWIIDHKTGYTWHNGGTSSYTSFVGFNSKNGTAVVVLSNYPSDDDDSDTIDALGYTLLNELNSDK